jgi:serine phosphatase RsbU (regulator of sigma subunit)
MLLNEIVNQKMITEPAEILKRLNKGVQNALQQNKKAPHSQDGMDIALISLNYFTKTIQYAGAINPLYLVKDKRLQVIEPDLQSIGGGIWRHEVEPDKTFTNHIISFEGISAIYITTDGYLDQFGGIDKSKLNSQRFKEMLLSINHLAPEDQYNKVKKTMEEWKGNEKQVDDMLLIGIKF